MPWIPVDDLQVALEEHQLLGRPSVAHAVVWPRARPTRTAAQWSDARHAPDSGSPATVLGSMTGSLPDGPASGQVSWNALRSDCFVDGKLIP